MLQELSEHGIAIDKVLFSHFHPDHISGLPALNSPSLYGNPKYQISLKQYLPLEKHHYFDGLTPLENDQQFNFGSFSLQVKHVQGHVICGMFTVINDKYIHVADDIMTSNHGEALLPSANKKHVLEHIASLELLKNYTSYTLLLSHGNALSGEQTILTAINNRQKYLQAVAKSETNITIEQALKGNEQGFLHQEWHDYVYL